MRAEQAIYTSARTRKARGYHLVAKSPGIDEGQARSLIQWCPSHASLSLPDTEATSLNFHPVTNGWVTLSRTMYGGPEYSSRGGLQIVTRALLVHCDQLAGYESDPITLASVALALGYLRLEAGKSEQLPHIDLPDSPIRVEFPSGDGATNRLADELTSQLVGDKRVAIVGAPTPLAVLAQLFARLQAWQRIELSFTTGLKPSLYRPFRLTFLPSSDLITHRQLASQGVTVLNANADAHGHAVGGPNAFQSSLPNAMWSASAVQRQSW